MALPAVEGIDLNELSKAQQLHLHIANGYRHHHAIGILGRMLEASLFDDELEAANADTSTGLFLPVMRTYSRSSSEIKQEIDGAATNLLKIYRAVSEGLIGKVIECIPEPQDDPSKFAWLTSKDSDGLVPAEPDAYITDSDSIVGVVSALDLGQAVMGIIPKKSTTAYQDGKIVCVPVAGMKYLGGKKQISPRGEFHILSQSRQFSKIGGSAKKEIISCGEITLFSPFPSGVYAAALAQIATDMK